MNNEISDWICSEKDYLAGVQLYVRFGQSQNLKRILSRSHRSDSTMATLEYELRKLVSISSPPPALRLRKRPEPILLPAAPVKVNHRKDIVHSQESDTLYKEIISLIKVRDQLHATLALVPEQQRKADALHILDLADEITDGYLRLDHLNLHGVLPPSKKKKLKITGKPLDELDMGELLTERNNARSSICRYKNWVNDPERSAALDHNISTLTHWETRHALILQLMKP